ncbi:MAG: outer membrane protein transport protein [Thiolinea sp.]
MKHKSLRIKGASLFGLMISALLAPPLSAGGFDFDGTDVDVLFKPGRMLEGGGYFAVPDREAYQASAVDRTGQPVTSGATRTEPARPLNIARATAKLPLGEQLDCMLAYREPFGVNADYGRNWVGRYQTTRFQIDSRSLRTACAYRLPLSDTEQLRVLGGVGVLDSSSRRQNMISPNALQAGLGITVPVDVLNDMQFDSDQQAVFYQLGAAYERPERAQRLAVVYTTQADVDLVGDMQWRVGDQLLNSEAVTTTLPWPATFEIRAETGLAADWLAFGQIRWQDWSRV